MKTNKAISILLLAVIIITAVECFKLTTSSLWHDEAFSGLLIQYDFNEMIDRIKLDVHPPLYYIVLKAWNFLFGSSLFSIRLFSVLFSVLGIATLYALVKRVFDKKLAIFSSLLFTVSYFQIQYAMEARMYAMGTFLVLASTYFFLKAIETKSWQYWLLYAIAVSAGIYTHYFVSFWIMAQAFYLLYIFIKEYKLKISFWIKDRNFKLGLSSYILAFISYIPWLPTFLKQTAQVQENYWIQGINIWSIPNTFLKMTAGGGLDPNKYSYALIALMIIVLAATIYFLIKNNRKEKWLVFLMLIFPFMVTIALSLKRSIFMDRYFIFGFPFYLIFIAGAILLINNKKIKSALIALVALGALTTFPFQWSNLEAEQKPGMAGAAEYLNSQYKEGNKIVVSSSLIYFSYRYYNETGYNAKLYAPDSLPHYSGTALLSPEDIVSEYNQGVKPGDIVWKIDTTGFGNWQSPPPDSWIKLDEKGFQDVYDYRGWILIKKYQVQ